MLYTLTLNPSLDYIMEAESLLLGETNRAKREYLRFGGKGINVAAVLTSLGREAVAVTPLGGKTGEMLASLLEEAHIPFEAFPISGETRINVKILSHGVTELNALGPAVTDKERESLLTFFDKLSADDTLVMCGSVPPSLPKDIYAQLMGRLSARGARVVLDTSGEALLNALPYRPYLVKPNKSELLGTVGASPSGEFDVLDGARALQKMGARNVLLSLGEEGALLLLEDGRVIRRAAPKGEAKNTVGAGDSMVAGFLYGESEGYETALRFAIAAGSATAFLGALADAKSIKALAEKM